SCLGGGCGGAMCQPIILYSGPNGEGPITVDAARVYWANSSTGTVMKVPVDGGPAAMLSTGQGSCRAIAVDATSVYWTSYSNGTVMKVGVDGGMPTLLASA